MHDKPGDTWTDRGYTYTRMPDRTVAISGKGVDRKLQKALPSTTGAIGSGDWDKSREINTQGAVIFRLFRYDPVEE